MASSGQDEQNRLELTIQGRLDELANHDDPLSRQYADDLRAYLKLLGKFNKVLSISDKYQELLSDVRHGPVVHDPRPDTGVAKPNTPTEQAPEVQQLLQHPDDAVRNLASRHQKLQKQLRKIMMISDGYLKELRDASLRLELMAKTDTLTGLSNRRGIIEKLEMETVRCFRSGYPMAILMLDIDGFKAVNDSHGHDVGDLVIKTVASRLQEQLRRSDSCSRWGGEEFVILCPECRGKQATVVAEKCRVSIMDTAIPTPDGELRVSISCGVAWSEQGLLEWEDLLKQADMAMYAAKSAGKNRIALYPV